MPRISEEIASKYTANVPEEYVFRSHDGRIFRNIRELGQALKDMSAETYAYHVNDQKDDFANWVRNIIGDERLAQNLTKSISQSQAEKAVARRIAYLEGKRT